eukprot:jgi/Antlo1/334/1660
MGEKNRVEEDMAEAVLGLLLLRSTVNRTVERPRSEKTSRELSFLEDIFEISCYPDGGTKQVLSLLLGMPPKTIQIWFQNRRRCLKSTVRRGVLAEKNRKSESQMQNERLYIKMCMDSKLGQQRSVPMAVIVRVYCRAFGISWNVS